MGSAGLAGHHDTAIARGPGVVLGRSGASFGQAHYCESDFWPHNTALYVTDFRQNDPRFVFYLLSAIDFSRHNSGGAQQSLNRNFIAPIAVALPQPNEQRLIAQALDDVDALLGALDRLIAKKRDIKQAAMQELLTGQTRLPGFSGDWEVKRLGELAQLYQPQTIGQSVFTDDGFPVYGANGIIGYYDRYNHLSPQITISCRGNCGTVNRTQQYSWINGNAMVVNLDRNNEIDSNFMYHLLTAQDFSILVTGSGQPQIVRGPLSEFQIHLPATKAEQAAIAAALSDMDAELEALEQRRAKTAALQQGMMQELLTGRTRLV
jgi:type I restriction enzyme S subunit